MLVHSVHNNYISFYCSQLAAAEFCHAGHLCRLLYWWRFTFLTIMTAWWHCQCAHRATARQVMLCTVRFMFNWAVWHVYVRSCFGWKPGMQQDSAPCITNDGAAAVCAWPQAPLHCRDCACCDTNRVLPAQQAKMWFRTQNPRPYSWCNSVMPSRKPLFNGISGWHSRARSKFTVVAIFVSHFLVVLMHLWNSVCFKTAGVEIFEQLVGVVSKSKCVIISIICGVIFSYSVGRSAHWVVCGAAHFIPTQNAWHLLDILKCSLNSGTQIENRNQMVTSSPFWSTKMTHRVPPTVLPTAHNYQAFCQFRCFSITPIQTAKSDGPVHGCIICRGAFICWNTVLMHGALTC